MSCLFIARVMIFGSTAILNREKSHHVQSIVLHFDFGRVPIIGGGNERGGERARRAGEASRQSEWRGGEGREGEGGKGGEEV